MGQLRSKCFKLPLSFQICIEKSVCHDCVWYDEHLGWISKMKNVAHIFQKNSKSILLPHLVMLGHKISMIFQHYTYYMPVIGAVYDIFSYVANQLLALIGVPF